MFVIILINSSYKIFPYVFEVVNDEYELNQVITQLRNEWIMTDVSICNCTVKDTDLNIRNVYDITNNPISAAYNRVSDAYNRLIVVDKENHFISKITIEILDIFHDTSVNEE